MSIIKGAQVAEAVSAETLKRAEALRLKGIEPCSNKGRRGRKSACL